MYQIKPLSEIKKTLVLPPEEPQSLGKCKSGINFLDEMKIYCMKIIHEGTYSDSDYADRIRYKGYYFTYEWLIKVG